VIANKEKKTIPKIFRLSNTNHYKWFYDVKADGKTKTDSLDKKIEKIAGRQSLL
jgi:hypothetical protein